MADDGMVPQGLKQVPPARPSEHRRYRRTHIVAARPNLNGTVIFSALKMMLSAFYNYFDNTGILLRCG